MRVLSIGSMYPPHHLGGYELMWGSAVRHLREAGHEARVLCSDYRAEAPEPAIPEGPDVHRELRWYWRDHQVPRRSPRQRLRIERHNLAVLERHLEELRPHVVNWWAMGAMSLSLIERARRLGLPSVGVVVDDWMVYGRRADGWQRAFGRPAPLRWAVERLTGVPTALDIGAAAHWLFVSEHVRRRAVEAGVEPASSEIAHGGISRVLFPPSPARPWGWRLLYVGRIDRRKGIATAIRALARLPEASLEVVGTGSARHLSRLRALVDELDVGDRVNFVQRPRDEIAAAYAEADAVLFPTSWDEPWGLVPLEAMSVGRPVIATGTGGSGEYLRDRENCLIFEPRDSPDSLAAAVRRLAGDAELRDRLREGGFATASRFSEERFNSAVAEALAAVKS